MQLKNFHSTCNIFVPLWLVLCCAWAIALLSYEFFACLWRFALFMIALNPCDFLPRHWQIFEVGRNLQIVLGSIVACGSLYLCVRKICFLNHAVANPQKISKKKSMFIALGMVLFTIGGSYLAGVVQVAIFRHWQQQGWHGEVLMEGDVGDDFATEDSQSGYTPVEVRGENSIGTFAAEYFWDQRNNPENPCKEESVP